MKFLNRTNFGLGLIFATFSFVGCRSTPTRATEESIAKARVIALTESINLDDQSKKLISENTPRCSFYHPAGPFSALTDYNFSWKISANRTLTVYGSGDVNTLENHKIRVR
ncbi:MAG TPA: hypothetical protein VG938_15320 [Verrucomicrobiae bacterium]|jgi:hypothetical protein|nr:hypothetical protein [Verrucomicrobiae bacterium]